MEDILKERIIFLDIDGVLNDKYYCNNHKISNEDRKVDSLHVIIDDKYLKRLSKVYKAYDKTRIVLSTSYKALGMKNINISYIRDRLREYSMDVLGLTPDTSEETGELFQTRPEEIYEWLRLHPDTNYWVSIEDDNGYEEYDKLENGLSEHLCLTEFGNNVSPYKCGLSLDKMHLAIEILGERYDGNF